MTTARDIITKAFQKNGVLTKHEALSGDEAADGLFSLNAMVGSWANESLIINTRMIESFALTSGQATYTMGSGGDFNTVRPIKILSAYIRQGNTDYPLEILPLEVYDRVQNKDTSTIPQALAIEPSYPLMRLSFYGEPYAGLTAFIRSEKPLTEFATLDTVIELPSGWERALIYNLAVETVSEYGQQVDQVTYDIASQSKGAIKMSIARSIPLDTYLKQVDVDIRYPGRFT
jgi:hypothetical protein